MKQLILILSLLCAPQTYAKLELIEGKAYENGILSITPTKDSLLYCQTSCRVKLDNKKFYVGKSIFGKLSKIVQEYGIEYFDEKHLEKIKEEKKDKLPDIPRIVKADGRGHIQGGKSAKILTYTTQEKTGLDLPFPNQNSAILTNLDFDQYLIAAKECPDECFIRVYTKETQMHFRFLKGEVPGIQLKIPQTLFGNIKWSYVTEKSSKDFSFFIDKFAAETMKKHVSAKRNVLVLDDN
ncbi:MAG: hypothetical protein VX642_08330 [Bdellovibrionota bacterium]|nr:hypothetical protein [Bdellovibrionota bacterium]